MNNKRDDCLESFSSFLDEFSSDECMPKNAVTSWLNSVEPIATGISCLLAYYGGCTFRNGVYRLHTPSQAEYWSTLACEAFPKYRSKIFCFASDWLGRQFVLDSSKLAEGQAQILLLDIGFNEALRIPINFSQFHNEELPSYANEALAEGFYLRWLEHGGVVPEGRECIGYRTPPTLGGEDDIENLELSDMEVYWGLLGQIHGG